MAELDEDSSSFEVVEDEISPTDLERFQQDSEAANSKVDQLCGSCLYVEHPSPEVPTDDSFDASPCPSDSSNAAQTPESAGIDAIVSHNQNVSASQKQQQRRLRATRSLPAVDVNHILQASGLSSTLHQKSTAVLLAVVSVALALLWTTIRHSYQMSQLQNELAITKLQHAEEILRLSKGQCDNELTLRNLLSELEQERRLLHELRLQSEERLNREVQSEKLIIDLQRERDKLIDELRAQSERHAASEAESTKMIVDLQAERHRLMNALDRSKHERTSDNKGKFFQDSVAKKFRKMKQSFRDFSKKSHLFPGMDYVQRFFCRIPRLCDDDNDDDEH